MSRHLRRSTPSHRRIWRECRNESGAIGADATVPGLGWVTDGARTLRRHQFERRYRGSSKLGTRVMWDYLVQLWRLAWAPQGFGRFLRYCLVGSSGVIIQLGILWWLRHFEILGKLRAAAVAVEGAIINNFLWNELWTFRDRTRGCQAFRDRLRRLVSFTVVCGVGALMQLAIIWGFAIQLRWSYLATSLFAIVLVTFWNYGFNTSSTWMKGSHAATP